MQRRLNIFNRFFKTSSSPRATVKANNAEYRRHRGLETLFLLFRFVTRETIESFVSRTNALLVSTLISIGDVGVSIAIVRAIVEFVTL